MRHRKRFSTQETLILIGSIGLFLFSVSRIPQSDAAVLPQAGAAATNVEARTSSTEPATRLVAIEQLHVGQLVRADAPTDELDLQFGTEVVSEDWRKLTLLAPKRDGSTADVVLLRPLTWLNEQKAEVGGTVFISVPECGIDGHAQVLAIEPCPEILPGDGRVITGTFRHQVSASISLSIAGQQEPILCTGNHPFWSESGAKAHFHSGSMGESLEMSGTQDGWLDPFVFNVTRICICGKLGQSGEMG